MENTDIKFENGDLIKVKSTGHFGTVARTRMLGNVNKEHIVIKLDNGEKKSISTKDLEIRS